MEKNNRNKQTQQRAYRQQYPIELPMVMLSFLVDLYGLKLAFGEDVRRIAKRGLSMPSMRRKEFFCMFGVFVERIE